MLRSTAKGSAKTPEWLASNGGTGTVTRGAVPDTGIEGDVWVDESSYMYRCSTAYNSGSTEYTLTTERSVPLEFVAVETTAYISVAIVDGGSSGAASLAKTGSGTFASPYLYTFTLYDDDSSNDSIIALLSGDAHLTANGSDANNVTVVAQGATPLTRTHESNYSPFKLEMHYRAELPDLIYQGKQCRKRGAHIHRHADHQHTE